MVMRISENMKFNTMVDNMFKSQESYTKLAEKIASLKEINRPSDDPVGMNKILNLRESRASIEQYTRNIGNCESWLTITESKLSAAGGLLADARVVAIAQATATSSAEVRSSEAGTVQQLIDEMLTLANSKYDGRYLFSGAKIQEEPFLSSERTAGEIVNTFTIDATNNKINFIEIGGTELELTATITEGTYTISELETAVETALDGAAGSAATYSASYDAETQKFTLSGSDLDGNVTEIQFLWGTGADGPTSSAGAILGFNAVDDTGETSYTGDTEMGEVFTVTATNNKIDFYEDGATDNTLEATLTNGNHTVSDLESEIKKQLEAASAGAGVPNSIDYTVSYDSASKKFTIEEEVSGGLTDLELLWETGTNNGISAASLLGFDAEDDTGDVTYTSDNAVYKSILRVGIGTVAAADGNTFDGDVTSIGTYTGSVNKTYVVKIIAYDNVTGDATYDVSDNGGANWISTGNTFTLSDDVPSVSIAVGDGMVLTFDDTGMADPELAAGDIFYVQAFAPGYYNGNGEEKSINIGEGESFTYSISGEAAFTDRGEGSVDVFEVLNDLKTALENNEPDTIASCIDDLKAASDQISTNISRCGARMNRLEIAKNNLTDLDLNLTKLLSDTEDADMSELITRFAMKETALQASYAMASKIGNLTILDFLR